MTDGKLYCYFVRKIGKNDDGGGEGVKNSSNFDDVICERPQKGVEGGLKIGKLRT